MSSEPSLFSFNPSHAVTTRSPSSDGGSYCTQGVVSVFLLMLRSLYFPLLPAQGCSAPPSAAQIRLFQPKNTKALQWKNTRTRPNHEHVPKPLLLQDRVRHNKLAACQTVAQNTQPSDCYYKQPHPGAVCLLQTILHAGFSLLCH